MGNYYEILGVSTDATEKEIKQAYRSLSLKYHPDRNQDDNSTMKFQEIGEAYETLSDTDKRQQYDNELNGNSGNPFGNGGMEEFADINNIFNMMFGGMGGFGGIHRMHSMGNMDGFPGVRVFHSGPGNFRAEFSTSFHHQQPPPVIKKIVEVTLEQCFNGISIPVEIEKWVIINNMKVAEIETMNITIPKGMDENDTLVLNGHGNVINDNLKGDIHINIKITNNTNFKRQGLDLYYKQNITIKEALCGFSFEIPHLSGKKLCLNNNNNPSVVKPNFKKIVPNLGMIRENTIGNLIIEFEIVFPDSLTPEQIEGISNIL